MDTDRNLLFGVLALQADLIDSQQFVEACTLWSTRKSCSVADLLIERGWLVPADREHVDYLLERKLEKHGGDARAGLAAVADDVKRSLAALGDRDIQKSLADVPAGSPPLDVTMDHVPPGRERYKLERLHATGGIGRVWLAHDSELGRDVALKELRPERARHATLGARFLQEAQITGQLEHPGIIPVYELVRGQGGKQPFYTMRFVNGRTLSEAARAYHEKRLAGQADPLELPALLNAFVTVCNTVAYAHSRGVIHRDLKGQNVILGDFGEVVVLDWGLAKLVGRPAGAPDTASIIIDDAGADSGYTMQGQALGTPAYMAPEQSAGRLELIDQRTDVYGLGAILYEILTGAPPFTGPNTDEVLRKVREEEPAPPRSICPEVPPALEAVCMRALAKQPADRLAAAADLAHEIRGWQEFERRKAEEALRESEELYHSLVETIPVSVWRKDLRGAYTFVNTRVCEVLGRPREQIIGKTDMDLYPPEAAEKYRRDDAWVLATDQTIQRTQEFSGEHEKRYVQVIKTALHDGHGKIIGTQGIAWDVTARMLAEEALRKQTEILQSILNSMSDGVVVADETGKFLLWNAAALRFLRKPDENVPQAQWAEYYGCYFPDAVTPYPVEQMPLSRAMRGEEVDEAELFIRHAQLPAGIVLSINARPLKDKEGALGGGVIVFRDVTARKKVEEELRKSRERFELAVLASQDGLWDWDVEGTWKVWYSPQMRKMLGYDEQEFPNQPGETEKRVHPDDHARWRAVLHGHVSGATDHLEMEYRMLHKDGAYRWVRDRAVALRRADGKAYRIAGSREDITARKRSEEELAHERHLLDSLMDTTFDGIYFKDQNGRFIRTNKKLAQEVGLGDPGQILGKTDFDLFSAEFARQAHADEQDILQTGRPVVAKEEKVTWADGRVTWVSTSKMPLRDPDGEIIGTFGISRDITQRKQAEETLRANEERYRSVIAAMQDGIVILDPDGSIRECNTAAERILGLSAEQMMGRTPHDPRWRAIHKDGSPFPGDAHPPMITLRTGRPCTDIVMGVHKPDGTLTWISINSQPLFQADGSTLAGVVASFEDISERKRMEEKLRQADAADLHSG